MVFVYYDHLCNGQRCFRHDCDNPEYVDCLHPNDVEHEDCPSCQYKKERRFLCAKTGRKHRWRQYKGAMTNPSTGIHHMKPFIACCDCYTQKSYTEKMGG